MSMADDIYLQRKNERAAYREKRREMEQRLHDEYMKGTPRARRAEYFARRILALVDKFVPDACREAAHEELMINAFSLDVEIAQVPADRDAKDAEAMNRAMSIINPVFVDASGTIIDKPDKPT